MLAINLNRVLVHTVLRPPSSCRGRGERTKFISSINLILVNLCELNFKADKRNARNKSFGCYLLNMPVLFGAKGGVGGVGVGGGLSRNLKLRRVINLMRHVVRHANFYLSLLLVPVSVFTGLDWEILRDTCSVF